MQYPKTHFYELVERGCHPLDYDHNKSLVTLISNLQDGGTRIDHPSWFYPHNFPDQGESSRPLKVSEASVIDTVRLDNPLVDVTHIKLLNLAGEVGYRPLTLRELLQVILSGLPTTDLRYFPAFGSKVESGRLDLPYHYPRWDNARRVPCYTIDPKGTPSLELLKVVGPFGNRWPTTTGFLLTPIDSSQPLRSLWRLNSHRETGSLDLSPIRG